MRRLGLCMLGALSLLVGGVAPAAAFVPDPGTYREMLATNLTCNANPCDAYVINELQAFQYQDGSTKICLAVQSDDGTNEWQEYGCDTTPPAFTFDKGFIVAFPSTSFDLNYTYPTSGFSRTVTASLDLALSGKPDRIVSRSSETVGNCTYRVTTRDLISQVTGTMTIDSAVLVPGNYNLTQSVIIDYTVASRCAH
jgi:hypothetical protein